MFIKLLIIVQFARKLIMRRTLLPYQVLFLRIRTVILSPPAWRGACIWYTFR